MKVQRLARDIDVERRSTHCLASIHQQAVVTHYSNNDVTAYAANKGLTPGTLLWATDVPLTEDAFRSGAKNAAAIDFLRWQDIAMEDAKGRGRIPPEQWGEFSVDVGQGISLFIKRMIPESSTYLGDSLEKAQLKTLKSDFDPIAERFWWKIEPGQPLPAGLQLVYDGVPPGHCTLTVTRPVTVAGFMSLVSMLHFSRAGTSYYGTPA
jgi:hypothetical protein